MKIIIEISDGDWVNVDGKPYQIRGMGIFKSPLPQHQGQSYHTDPELRLVSEDGDEIKVEFSDSRAIAPEDLKGVLSLVEIKK